MDEEIDNPPLGLDHRGFIRSEVSLAQVLPPYLAATAAPHADPIVRYSPQCGR